MGKNSSLNYKEDKLSNEFSKQFDRKLQEYTK